MTVEESQYQYDGLVDRVGCTNTSDTLACLRNVDIEVIAENNINVPTPGGAGNPPIFMWSNVIDGNFTTDYTYNMFSLGKFVKVPAIFGDDTNEGTIFTPFNINSTTAMNSFLQDQFVNLTADNLNQIDRFYPKAQQFQGKGPFWRAAANAYGEMRYICPGIYISSMISSHGEQASYNYHWDVLSAINEKTGLGVTHTSEVPSIWGSSSAPDNALIPTIQAYWASFIRTKDPNTYRLKSAPEWTTFNSTGMERIHFPKDPSNVSMEVVPSDQQERCTFWSNIGAGLEQR